MPMPVRDIRSVPMISDDNPSVYLRGVPYRGYKIIQTRDHFLFEVQSLDGNPVPHKLTSKFTAVGLVQRTIDDFLESNNENAEDSGSDND